MGASWAAGIAAAASIISLLGGGGGTKKQVRYEPVKVKTRSGNTITMYEAHDEGTRSTSSPESPLISSSMSTSHS